jgi:hypothetical protein
MPLRMRLAGLDDPGCDFQETKTQRRELGSGQFLDFGNGVAHGQYQPISCGIEHETDLVGERRTPGEAYTAFRKMVESYFVDHESSGEQ